MSVIEPCFTPSPETSWPYQRRPSRSRWLALALASLTVAAPALADSPPRKGTLAPRVQKKGGSKAAAKPGPRVTPLVHAPTSRPAIKDESGAPTDDHLATLGRYGFGLLGVQRVPDREAGISAPTLGVRHWLDRKSIPKALQSKLIKSVAVELGVGLGFESKTGAGTTHALALHGAMPLAFAHGGHFAFIGVPGLDFAFSVGASRSVMIAASARVGAEIYFGFMGIPQLALQATVGAELRFEHAARDGEASLTQFRTGTTVEGKPWDIFTNNISAIYYF